MEHKSIPTALATSERISSFLNLPRELRLMVYKYLTVKVKYHALDSPAPVGDTPAILLHSQYLAILVKKTLPGAMILATCRTINEEASSMIAQKIEYLRQQPIQYILDWHLVNTFNYTDFSSGEKDRIVHMACDFDPKWSLFENDSSLKPNIKQFVEKCKAWETRYHSTTDLKGITKSVVFISRQEPDADPQWSKTGVDPRNDKFFFREVVPSGRFISQGHAEFREQRKTRLECVIDFPVDPVNEDRWRSDWEEGEFLSVQAKRNPVWIEDYGTFLLVQVEEDSIQVLKTT